MIVEFLLFIAFLGILFRHVNKKPERYPPGPFNWPLVGNLFQLGEEPYKTAVKWTETYGNVIGIYFGTRRTIIINDLNLAKEAYGIDALNGRPAFGHVMHPDSGKKRGVLNNEGSDWVEQRRFVLKNLRDFGFGKKSMESLVHEEVDAIIEDLLTTVGKPIDTHGKFNVAVINALWAIVTGEKFSHSDPKIRELMDLISANMRSRKVMRRAVPFPWLSKIAPNFSGHNEYVAKLRPILKFIQDAIDIHKETYEEGTKRDLIDCFLQEIRQASQSSSFKSKKGEENMLFGLYDLFFAGSETTSTTLSWICFLLAHNPKIQEKLHKVISKNVGTARKSCLADRQSMPYVEAFLMEIQRYCSVAPFGARHEAMENVEFHGHVIPKGAMLMVNLFAIMHDPKTWGDPETFRPERFLSPDEKTVLRNEALVPFAMGKRICLAETLTKDELFLFTTGIFQRFKVQFDPNAPNQQGARFITIPVRSPSQAKIVFLDRYDLK